MSAYARLASDVEGGEGASLIARAKLAQVGVQLDTRRLAGLLPGQAGVGALAAPANRGKGALVEAALRQRQRAYTAAPRRIQSEHKGMM